MKNAKLSVISTKIKFSTNMGHTKAENDIAIEQIKKLNEKNPLKEYDVDSFVQGMRYAESKWISVNDELPKALKTVWLTNGKEWGCLGCLVESDGGWHWAANNGVIYIENGEIVSECESEDLDVKFWCEIPKLPMKITNQQQNNNESKR